MHKITLTGEDFHHISRVMRMEAGSLIYTVIPDGRTFISKIMEIKESEAVAEVTEWGNERLNCLQTCYLDRSCER